MRQIRRLAAIVLIAAAMSVAPRAQGQTSVPPAQPAPQPAAPAPAPKLTGGAAWAAMVGNTIDGKLAGQDFADFFDKGGAVRHVDENGLSTGTWALQNDKLCLDFPEEDEHSCMTLEVTGTQGVAQDEDENVMPFVIQPGNSKGL